jgi:hypothetical protein
MVFRTPWPSLEVPPNGKGDWSHGRRLLGTETSVAGPNGKFSLPPLIHVVWTSPEIGGSPAQHNFKLPCLKLKADTSDQF